MMEMDEMKGKGKRGLLRVVFGRTAFFLLFIALQLAVLYRQEIVKLKLFCQYLVKF